MAQNFFIPFGGGGAPVTDHFAPRYLVGNIPAGDPAAAQGAPFSYIPDPGDGTGIAAALAAAAVVPGDVWIRPGVYDLANTLVVPAGVRVQGAGVSTIIRGGVLTQVAIDAGSNSQLRDLRVEVTGFPVALGASAVICRGVEGLVSNVEVQFSADPGGQLRNGIEFPGPITAIRAWYVNKLSVFCVGGETLNLADPVRCIFYGNALVSFNYVTTNRGDIGIDGTGGAWVGVSLFTWNWFRAGLRSVGGTFRFEEGSIRPNAAAVSPIGAMLDNGGDHQLRAVNFDAANQGGSISVRINGGSDGSAFDGCRFLNWQLGVEGNAGNEINISQCRFQTQLASLRCFNRIAWKIEGCEIINTSLGDPTVLILGGESCVISDTRIRQTNTSGVPAVRAENTTRFRAHDNDIEFNDIAGIALDGNTSFSVVHDNTFRCLGGQPAVTTAVGTSVNNIRGNTAQGNIAPIVDLGAGNEISHNIGGP